MTTYTDSELSEPYNPDRPEDGTLGDMLDLFPPDPNHELSRGGTHSICYHCGLLPLEPLDLNLECSR